MAHQSKNERVRVAVSPIHGHGLFAVRPLQAGQLIGEYDGTRVDKDGIYVLWIEGEPGESWTGYDGKNEMRFMNHADSPNAEMDGLDCYALQDIAVGDEITIDYGWEDS